MGNTNIVVGGIDEKGTAFLERVTTDTHKTDLEYAVTIKIILEIHKTDPASLEGAILSSVVPPLNSVLLSAVKKVTGKNCLLVGAGMKTGLNILTDNPGTVGADLIVDSVAAIRDYPPPIIVIDMGTATTITVVNKKGAYIGGVICPGLVVSLESLSNRTAQLPHINLDHPGNVIASNTVDSMRSGILYGHAGMMDGIIDRMEAELGEKASIVATGGLASFVSPLCRHAITVDDSLLLKGLLILYRRNT